MNSPLQTTRRPLSRYNDRMRPWKPCFHVSWMIVSGAEMRTLLHSRTVTTARYTIQHTLVHLILVLNRRIPGFTFQSMLSSEKILTAAEERHEFLATLQHSCHCARDSFQCTEKQYKRDFDNFFCKSSRESRLWKLCVYWCIGLRQYDLKLEHAVWRPYRVFRQGQHTVTIPRKHRNKRTTADRSALAPLAAGMLPIPPESASAGETLDKSLKGTLWLFHEILEHYMKADGQFKFLFS